MHGLHAKRGIKCMEQTVAAVQDLISPLVLSCLPAPWGGLGPLVRSKEAVCRVLDFEQIILLACHGLETAAESARSICTGSAQTWPNRPSTHVVPDAPACVDVRHLFSFFWCSKDEPPDHFSIVRFVRHKVAYAFNKHQAGTICLSHKVIKSGIWLVSNGRLVAEMWSFRVLECWGASKLSLHCCRRQTIRKLSANQNAYFRLRKVPCERM